MDGMPRDYGRMFYRFYLSLTKKAYSANLMPTNIFRKLNAIKTILEHFWALENVDITTYELVWPGSDVSPER